MLSPVDRLLEERENQGARIRIGLAGAGVMARTVATHLLTPVPGLRLAAVANRTVEHAHAVFAPGGRTAITVGTRKR